jgi:RHH-type proline utilization regulon transcriptional repressor/proline dehydrogenase/delta 1-pyrroline-5-carboxylate dehydrogenase
VRRPGEEDVNVWVPRGVTAVISPWNFPVAILCGMTSAALVTGNPVIMKPAEQTPACAEVLYRCFRDAGVPGDVLHLLPGRGEIVGQRLVEHPDTAAIVFTGSRAVGRLIAERALATSTGTVGLKRVVLEMGGKNAIIVDDDADLDEAVPAVLASAFGYAGQKCSACSRVIAVGGAHDAFLDRLVAAARSLVVGPADDPATFVGPLIDTESVERLERYADIARSEGRIHYQMELPAELRKKGHFYPPTIVTGLPAESRVLTEEIFGPLLAVVRAGSFDDALAIANSTDYALTGGLYSRSPAHIDAARERFDVGNLYINRKITGALVHRQPFGGHRHSGVGQKAGGPDYLRQFMAARCISENTLRRGFAPE